MSIKKIILAAFIFAATAFTFQQCSSDDKEEIQYGEAALTSIGLEASNNKDLEKDIFATSIDPAMELEVPEYMDLKELSVSFTATENDTVSVNNKIVQSGEIFNFTNPIEFKVFEGTNIKRYTLSVVYEHKAQLNAFGIYAEDNKGVLKADAVAETISEKVTLKVPEGTDVTALAVRFEVSMNDIVLVNDKEIKSGDKVDFTGPVDFYVKDGASVERYTVTIEFQAAVWTKIGTTSIGTPTGYVMAINPATNLPEIAYVQKDDAGVMRLKYLVLDGTSFKGANDFVSTAVFKNGSIGFAFDNSNHPMVSFLNDANQSVLINNGSSWGFLGAQGFGDRNNGQGSPIIALPNNDIMTVWANNAAGAVAKREANVAIYSSSAWVQGNTITSRTSGLQTYRPVFQRLGDVIYLSIYNPTAVSDVAAHSLCLYKYENGNWSTVFEGYRPDVPADATGLMYGYGMDLDEKNGEIYFSITYKVSSDYNIYALRYNIKENKWYPIASPMSSATNSVAARYHRVVEFNGCAILMYLDKDQIPCIVRQDSQTKQWQSAFTFEGLKDVTDIDMVKAPNGIVYAVAYDTTNGQLVLYKYE